MAKDTQDQQMELMLQEGGMKDDGMTRDPVSGNEVPPGSLASEVRDDIPAQLSEGEYVIPADVVQFFGLKFFEDLIAEAKRGLEDMNRRGRIGGSPIPQEASMPSPQKPDDFPFEIAELQTKEPTPQMNKGGVLKAYTGVATVDQSGSGQTYTPKLDNTATEQYFNTTNAGGRMIRFVADGCKQKTVLAQADRVPIASGAYEGGYVDITSDAGLDIVSKCNEINLNSNEEQTVVDRIGQDEYNSWKNGQTRTGDDEPPEEQNPSVQSNDDDGGAREVNKKDFIENYDINQLANYADDVATYYGKEDDKDGFFTGLIKGVVNPVIKLNHKHVVARASDILRNGGYIDAETGQQVKVNTERDENGNYIDPQAQMLSGILKSNPGGMEEGEKFKVRGIIYEYKGGKHVIYDPKKKVNVVGGNPRSGGQDDETLDAMGDLDNYIDLTFNVQDYSNTGLMTASLDPTQGLKQQYDNYVLDSQAGTTDLTTRSEMERGTQAKRSGGDAPTGDSGSYLADNFGKGRDDDDDDDNFPPTPTLATDYASGIMNERDDGASLEVEKNQYNKAQADLSDAYGGGEAAEKFKMFNEGGMPTKKTIVKKRAKRKTATKKK